LGDLLVVLSVDCWLISRLSRWVAGQAHCKTFINITVDSQAGT
jgi:hypothetical protein